MSGDITQWFIRSRPNIYIGIWLAWFLSPLIVMENLHELYRLLWTPAEVRHAVSLVYATAWLVGVFALSILLIVGLHVAPGVSADASQAQLEYELKRSSSSKSKIDSA